MIRKPNFILIALICTFVVVEILFLRPSSVETGEQATTGMFKSIESLVESQKMKDEVGYTMEGFHYTSVEKEIKQWEMVAREAVLYENSRLVHANVAQIKMFDPIGKITLIEGDEAHYRMGERDLELIGNVKVTFPDGFWIKTTKAYYSGMTGEITSKEAFHGEAMPQKGEVMQIWGTGFKASKNSPDVHVSSNAHVKMRRLATDEITDVRSDHVRIDRAARIAYFSMAAQTNYVESTQGTLFVRSKRQEATYDPQTSALKYMTAYEDVLIREMDEVRGKNGLKYATSQKADFLTQEDKILLSGFPSAYQEHDTLTGELITIYRKKNLVEVTHANAYHEGRFTEEQQQQQQPQR